MATVKHATIMRYRSTVSWSITLGTLGFASICLRMIVLYNRQSDFDFHVEYSRRYSGLVGAGYSLLFPLLQISQILVGNVFSDLDILASIVISATIVRHFLSIRLVKLLGGSSQFAHIISSALTLFMPLYDPRLANTEALGGFQQLYLGQISPNVWHNSTTIILLPAAVWAAIRCHRFFAFQTWRSAVLFSVSIVIATMMKPSLLIASFPAFVLVCLFVIARDRKRATVSISILQSTLIIMASLGILALMYLAFRSNGPHSEIGFVLDPFRQWNEHSDNIPWSVILSLAILLPLGATFTMQKIETSHFELWIITTFIGALSFYILFAEALPDGSLRLHGNGYWGIVPSFYLLLLVSLSKFHVATRGSNGDWRLIITRLLVTGLVLLHVVSGAMYLLLIAQGRINPF